MTILTIGHSNHEVDQFIALLRLHRVTALADVRSSPHSRRYPQYCKSALNDVLRQVGIAYVFLGDALGGRPPTSLLAPEGHADYARMARQPVFLAGLSRLNAGASRYQVAIMCAEADPADCHRALLIGRQLDANGTSVEHIHRDGGIETQAALEGRLLALANLAHDDRFTPLGERVVAAYQYRVAKVAWRPESGENDS